MYYRILDTGHMRRMSLALNQKKRSKEKTTTAHNWISENEKPTLNNKPLLVSFKAHTNVYAYIIVHNVHAHSKKKIKEKKRNVEK